MGIDYAKAVDHHLEFPVDLRLRDGTGITHVSLEIGCDEDPAWVDIDVQVAHNSPNRCDERIWAMTVAWMLGAGMSKTEAASLYWLESGAQDDGIAGLGYTRDA